MTERSRGYDKYLDPEPPGQRCARPGCGCHGDIHFTAEGCAVHSVCPAYRTPDQQEAWEAVDYAIEHRHDCYDLAIRLRELYP